MVSKRIVAIRTRRKESEWMCGRRRESSKGSSGSKPNTTPGEGSLAKNIRQAYFPRIKMVPTVLGRQITSGEGHAQQAVRESVVDRCSESLAKELAGRSMR